MARTLVLSLIAAELTLAASAAALQAEDPASPTAPAPPAESAPTAADKKAGDKAAAQKPSEKSDKKEGAEKASDKEAAQKPSAEGAPADAEGAPAPGAPAPAPDAPAAAPAPTAPDGAGEGAAAAPAPVAPPAAEAASGAVEGAAAQPAAPAPVTGEASASDLAAAPSEPAAAEAAAAAAVAPAAAAPAVAPAAQAPGAVTIPTSQDFRVQAGNAAAPSPVVDQSEETESALDEDGRPRWQRGQGLRFSISGQLSANQGAFRLDQGVYERNPMVAWSTSFSPSYQFADTTRISASASLNQELTLADGDDDPQTLLFGDVSLGLSRLLYRFEDGPRISGSLSATLPTSDASRAATLRTSIGMGVGVSHALSERWFLSFNSAFRKNFHEYTSPVRDPRLGGSFISRDGLAVADLTTGIARAGGPELRSESVFVEPGVLNTSFSISNGIGVSYSATERLGLSVNYQLSHSFVYEGYPVDELSGVGARGGRGRRDSHAASISANYRLLENLSVSAGIANGGSPRTADDRRIRIPFLSLEGRELTMFSVGVTYTQPVPL